MDRYEFIILAGPMEQSEAEELSADLAELVHKQGGAVSWKPYEEESGGVTEAGKCRDCRFWGWPDEEPGPSGAKDCTLFSAWAEIGRPMPRIDWPSPLAVVIPNAGADEGGFVTSPEFGCVQWQRVDDAQQTP